MAKSVTLNQDLKNRIQHLADARHGSAHWIMREAIRSYVEREEKREAFKQDALHAWEAYQENGLHLTLEEADSWLAKLDVGEEAVLPECHT